MDQTNRKEILDMHNISKIVSFCFSFPRGVSDYFCAHLQMTLYDYIFMMGLVLFLSFRDLARYITKYNRHAF